MRTSITALLLAVMVSVTAKQPSASEQLKEKFFAILREQVNAMMNELRVKRHKRQRRRK